MTGAAPRNPAVADGRPWTGRSRGGVVGNWIFVRLVRLLGVRPAYALLAFVALYYVLCAPQARRASAEYRRRLEEWKSGGVDGWQRHSSIHPSIHPIFQSFLRLVSSWLRRLWGAYRHFFAFGQLLLDRVAILAGRPGSFRIEFDGEEHMRSALQEGKGLVIVSAHCGNWEAAGHLLSRLGAPVNVVAYRGESAALRRFFEKALAEHRFSLIEADGSPDAALAVMAALARGEVVAMHGDRVLGDEGVVVPFLGAPARFPAGPHAVAALSGSPLIHAFALREGAYAYRFHAYPPERPRFGSRETRSELLREWVLRFVTRLESKLRDYPLQWCNFYPFWESAT